MRSRCGSSRSTKGTTRPTELSRTGGQVRLMHLRASAKTKQTHRHKTHGERVFRASVRDSGSAMHTAAAVTPACTHEAWDEDQNESVRVQRRSLPRYLLRRVVRALTPPEQYARGIVLACASEHPRKKQHGPNTGVEVARMIKNNCCAEVL